jgi:hypothetical protein
MKPGTCRLVGLRGYLNDRPPTELEATFYATKRTKHALLANPVASIRTSRRFTAAVLGCIRAG